MLNSVQLNFIGQAPDSRLEYVEYIEEGYVSGCVGQVKYITDYDSAGNIMKKTQFFYANTTYPTKVTRILELAGDE